MWKRRSKEHFLLSTFITFVRMFQALEHPWFQQKHFNLHNRNLSLSLLLLKQLKQVNKLFN